MKKETFGFRPATAEEIAATTEAEGIEGFAKEYARQSYLVSEENHPKEDGVIALKNLTEYHHHQLQKAREEEREKCIKIVEDYGKSMSKLHSEMIGTAHEDSKMMLAFDMRSRLIAVKHITEKMNHSELDQEVNNK